MKGEKRRGELDEKEMIVQKSMMECNDISVFRIGYGGAR